MNCKICEKPSGIYPLCSACFKLRDAGKVTKCEECGEWHYSDKPCKCTKTTPKTVTKEPPKDETSSDLTCIICGEPSNGKHFCLKCYKEFKDHSVDIRITNCRDTEVIDRYGNKKVKTKDGRFVRSLSEKIILDYFFDHFTRVVYEKTISYVNDKGENAELHPDFYLTDYDLYLEFNGLTNKTYLKKKDYVNKIYASKGFKVVILDSNDINDIESTLDKVLEEHKK